MSVVGVAVCDSGRGRCVNGGRTVGSGGCIAASKICGARVSCGVAANGLRECPEVLGVVLSIIEWNEERGFVMECDMGDIRMCVGELWNV